MHNINIVPARWARVTIAAIIVLTAVSVFSLRWQLDRERTRQASLECEFLARMGEEALKSGDDLTIGGIIFELKRRGPAVHARVLDANLVVRNSTETVEFGKLYSGPCVKESAQLNPGAPPAVCSGGNQPNGLLHRVFALPVRNPITGTRSGLVIVNYPEDWFPEGFISAAVPSLVAGGIFLLMGLVLLIRKAGSNE